MKSVPAPDLGLHLRDVTTIAPKESSLQERLGQAIDEFYAALDAGQSIDRQQLLEKYSDIAEELRDCLHNLDFIQHVRPELADPSANQSDQINDTVSVRAHLGDFRIVREVGRGGMGVVYEAEQISLGRRVALKVLPFAAMLDRQQLARFKNEARAAGTLDHPNIVAIHSVGCERGVHYYAMQLIEGQSLAETIAFMKPGRPPTSAEAAPTAAIGEKPPADDTAKAALPTVCNGSAAFSSIPPFASREYFRSVAQLGIQAAEALDHAHQNGILHRDIKPANLLVDDAGKLWITDFGLARMEQDAGMTMTGDLLGTLRYMSPEQALAKRVVVDHRSDIYSLGVTLYELLTLQPAYAATDRQELLHQIAFNEPRKPRQLNSRIPQDLETIVLILIEKNPADRYATAQELADDLRRFLQNQSIKAKPASYFHQLMKWSRRHRSGVTAATIVTILLLMFTTAVVADRWRQVREGTEFVRSSVVAARTALGAADVRQAGQRVSEAQSRIDAYRLGDRGLTDEVAMLGQECDRYAKFELLLEKARNQRSEEQSPASAEEGLELYHVMDNPNWLDLLRDAGLPETHLKRIVEAAYELLLLKADHLTRRSKHRSPENTRLAVKYLEQAASFHAPSRGYYWLLANCSHFLGDREKEAQLRKTALDTPVHHAAELFYINRDRQWGTVASDKGYPIDESYKDHREMLRFDPSYYNGLFFMGMRLGDAGRHAESLGAWYACLALQPDDWPALYNRGNTFLAIGHYDEAIADYRAAIRLMKVMAKTQRPVLYLNLGNALHESGQRDEAIASYREAIRIDPKFADAYNNLGLALNDNASYDEALAAYQRAIEIKPDDAVPHGNLANTLLRLGRLDEAIREYREAIRLGPESDRFNNHVGLAIVFRAQDKIDDSIAEFREAARIKPDDALIHARLGASLKEKGSFEEAIAELREAIRLNPDEAAAYYQLGAILESKGLIVEAIAEFRAAATAYRNLLRQKPDDPLAQADLAGLLATGLDSNLRNPPEALELAKKAVKQEPLNREVWLVLGIAHYRMGNWQDAIEALHKSTQLPSGGDSSEWFFLAMAEWQLGNRDAAREWYTKAVQWLEKNRPEDAELIRFRKEVEGLLDVLEPRQLEDKSTTTDTTENANLNPEP